MFPVTFLVEISGIEPLTSSKKHLKLYYPHPSIVNTEFQEVVDILLYFH